MLGPPYLLVPDLFAAGEEGVVQGLDRRLGMRAEGGLNDGQRGEEGRAQGELRAGGKAEGRVLPVEALGGEVPLARLETDGGDAEGALRR